MSGPHVAHQFGLKAKKNSHESPVGRPLLAREVLAVAHAYGSPRVVHGSPMSFEC